MESAFGICKWNLKAAGIAVGKWEMDRGCVLCEFKNFLKLKEENEYIISCGNIYSHLYVYSYFSAIQNISF